MKELISKDLVHKKLSFFFIDNLKLHMWQLVGLHSDIKSIMGRVDNAKAKACLMIELMFSLSMIRINKRLKRESQLSQRITKVEERVNSTEKTLHTLVQGTIHTNKLLQQLFDTPTLPQTLDDNKKGEKVSTVNEP